MNNNTFFEKVGKLTFSIVLTSITVTAIVYAASWDTLNDGDTVNGTIWQSMVGQINGKINLSDIPTCGTSQNLTFDGSSFQCTTPASAVDVVQAGTVYHSQGMGNASSVDDVKNIVFDTPYSVPPVVSVAITGFWLSNSSRSETFNLSISPSSISKTGFTLSLSGESRNNHNMRIQSATWIAVPQEGGTWSSSTSTSHTSTCYTSSVATESQTGGCVLGSNHTYYGGGTQCVVNRGGGRMGEPSFEQGTKYSTKYTQTCQ